MKNQPELATKRFVDEFDLPLHEGTSEDTYTLSEIEQEVNKRIAKLSALGTVFSIPPDYITEYKIVTAAAAIAYVEPIAEHGYRFAISTAAAKKHNEQYLDTIIYHELCHILQVEFLVRENVLFFQNGHLYYNQEKRDTARTLYDRADSHTALWYMFVDYVNFMFEVNPPIARFLNLRESKDISDLLLEETFTKKVPIPVERKVFVDDFGYLLDNVEEEAG